MRRLRKGKKLLGTWEQVQCKVLHYSAIARATVRVICRTQVRTKFEKVAAELPRANYEASFVRSLNYSSICRAKPVLPLRENKLKNLRRSRQENTNWKAHRSGAGDEKNEERFARFPPQSARCSRDSAISQRHRDYTHQFALLQQTSRLSPATIAKIKLSITNSPDNE